MKSTLLPVILGPSKTLSPPPIAIYDEQLGLTFTQSFASIAYNVTAVPQADFYGYGPAYLLNGLSNDGYWYQVGLSYNWPYTIGSNGGYSQGFNLNYEVFNSVGNSIYPTNGDGGLQSFSGPVNSGDLVLLNLYFSNGFVYMYARDWNTGAVSYVSYADSHTSSFIGLSSPDNSNGFFTGLMTEWWHANPYNGDETAVTYSDPSFGLSSAWMWMDEWEPSNPSWSGAWSHKTQVTYSSNPNLLQSLSYNGATEYSSAYKFITGSIVSQTTSITLLPAGGSTPLSSTNEFAVSFTLGGQQQINYAQNGTLTFNADSGTNVVIFGVSTDSSSTEKWVLNSQGTNVTVPAGSTTTFYYYDQYQVIAGYSTSDGSVPSSNPILSGTQCGSNYQLPLTTTNQTTWLDANTPWSTSTIATATSGTERWSSSAGTSGTVTTVLTINPMYVHQYYLTVVSTYGSTSGSGWYNSGSTAYTSIASNTVSGGSGIQYVLTGWSGDSSGSGATSNVITMNAPKTTTASWVTQYYLAVSSAYGSPSPASGWFNAGSSINEAVTSSVPAAEGTQYVCTGWTGSGSITSSGNTLSTTFTINVPTTVNWSWKKQYYLNMSTNFGSATPGSCWQDTGANVTISATAPAVQNGERYEWNGWSGLSNTIGAGNSVQVTMNEPLTAVASWIHQYMVTVNSPYGSPSPLTGWFNAGTDITFSVNSPSPESIISQHVCTGWTGTGSTPATGANASLHFMVNQPSSITWKWESQFILPMVLLLAGVPSAIIIVLSIYLLRHSKMFPKRK